MQAIAIEAVEVAEVIVEADESAIAELSLAQLALVGGGDSFVDMA
jgi:hypothetical protein